MKKQTSVFFLIMASLLSLSKAQVGGNQIYRDKNNNDYSALKNLPDFNNANSYFTNDSTLVVNVKVLMNKTADRYKLTLGLNEEAATPKIAIENINRRINGFIKRISSMGIRNDDIFVDFISQTKIYDYDINKDTQVTTQKMDGFETKKNIIITVNKHSMIEKLISEASDFQIYDVIKVDYISNDIDKIQEDLLKEAYAVFDKKKDNYFKLFKKEIIGSPTATSGFTYTFPKNQYQNYAAFESASVTYGYDSRYVKKEERKSKTFYYDGTDYTGFDKVINNSDPEVGIQYIMNLSVKYDLKKNKEK
ncbi:MULTISPECIES: SIMPL domain-containing protein [unclassified Chryseobacterium]|uniref:SIMPL domain-containing protein n=1 Tax=unclassified Chryseobacterium TaxID=2593645 RepID=UPI002853550B|nr:SIMPL domain-containing protein [Chryseobacterium sp. CFS7]MDR4891165.1 SIMPL domain-containing protein [Chryseobacterium sp. CFS7]